MSLLQAMARANYKKLAMNSCAPAKCARSRQLQLAQHAKRRPAAEAAMCAGAQGKFWKCTTRCSPSQEKWQALRRRWRSSIRWPARRASISTAGDSGAIGEDEGVDPGRPRPRSGGGRVPTPTFIVGNRMSRRSYADRDAAQRDRFRAREEQEVRAVSLQDNAAVNSPL